MRTFWWPLGRAIYPFHEIIYSAKKKKLHPGRLTWSLRIHPWKRKIIFQIIIFRFHVNLPECIQNDSVDEVLIQRSTWVLPSRDNFSLFTRMKAIVLAGSFWFCWKFMHTVDGSGFPNNHLLDVQNLLDTGR